MTATADQDYPTYDFVTASRVERPLARQLKVWMAKFCKLFAERWSDFAATKIEVSSMLLNAQSFQQTQQQWTRPAIGHAFEIDGKSAGPIPNSPNSPNSPNRSATGRGNVTGMMVIERSDFLILMMEILMQSIDSKPVDRELTSIETSMLSLIFQSATDIFGQAWPAKETLQIDLGSPITEPDNCRLFPPQTEVLVTGFEIKTEMGGAAGSAKLQWIFEKESLKALLGVENETPASNDTRKISSQLVEGLEVELIASLGTTELLVSDLVNLAPGSIVRLDQSIHQPLSVSVNQTPILQAWPGKQDQNSSVLIEGISVASERR